MIELIKWKGPVTVNGKTFPSIDEAREFVKGFEGELKISLFDSVGTVSGRFKASEPNVSNAPKTDGKHILNGNQTLLF